VSEHISRREPSRTRFTTPLSMAPKRFTCTNKSRWPFCWLALVGAIAYGSWTVYHDRQTAAATAETQCRDEGLQRRIGTSAPDPQDPSEISYKDEAARSSDALNKFNAVANKYPSRSPETGLALRRALLEDLEHQNRHSKI